MTNLFRWLIYSPSVAPKETIWIRFIAGGIFFWEGILKFVYTNQGVGRFTKLGFQFPETTAHFVGSLEILGGLFLLFGLFTRPLALVFIGEMIVAMLSTKITLYLGTYPLPLPSAPPFTGFWAVLHEIRSEYSQLLSCVFLLLVGPGPKSMDAQWIYHSPIVKE